MMAQHLTNIGSVHYVDCLDIECFSSQQNQLSAYFTSVQILSILNAVTDKKETVTSAKGRIYLIYKLADTTF